MTSSGPETERSQFPRTRWSLVLGAQGEGSDEARRALHELCRLYWQPLYSFIRRSGHGKEDAEDFTQEFLAQLIDKGHLDRVEKERGKLRSFFLTYLKFFLADKNKAAKRQKRGGTRKIVSIDQEAAEARYHPELAHEMTPDRLFERRWALTLLEIVLEKLEAGYVREGKADLFAALKPGLQWGGDEASLRESAGKMGMREGTIKVAAFRLRKRYRHALRQEIAATIAEGEDIDEEMRHLFQVLRG